MSKEEVVSAQKEAILSSLEQALGAAYDAGMSEGGAAPAGSFSQSDLDKAVADRGVADQTVVDAIQAELDKAKSDDQADKDSIAKLQGLLDQIKGLLG